MIKYLKISLISSLLLFSFTTQIFAQTKDLLSPEENLWLKSRNNTIVVYPEKNNPPFSYTSTAGSIQGLGIDYIELIAEKIGAKIEYLSPQSLNQILNDFPKGKGDVIADLMETDERASDFIFTDSFVTVPAVIVARKDFEKSSSLTLNDFNGKRISVISGSALEKYIHKNYPRIVIESVTDDEISLQQVVLGEVDGAAIDIASLSFYLSKQVLNSVKIVGNTGFDYKPAFGIMKDKTILQSMLDKGMTQISASDRSLLNEKWILVPDSIKEDSSLTSLVKNNFSIILFYFVLILVLVVVGIFVWKRRENFGMRYLRKAETIEELKKEVSALERADDMLAEEMKVIKAEESKLQEKLRKIDK